MTVENWLRAKIDNTPVESNIIEAALLSALEVGLPIVKATDDVSEVLSDVRLNDSLLYALSTLYYSASGVSGGSSRTEKVGDVSVSVAAWTIDWSRRELWLRRANEIRMRLGYATEEVTTDDGGAFDASHLRKRSWN